jgi:hypothetical protein
LVTIMKSVFLLKLHLYRNGLIKNKNNFVIHEQGYY